MKTDRQIIQETIKSLEDIMETRLELIRATQIQVQALKDTLNIMPPEGEEEGEDDLS